MTSKAGFFFFNILDIVLRLQCYALRFAAPPCSLFVWLSMSVHRRSAKHLLGDTANYKVRLSSLILANLVPLLRLASERSVWWILEQPSSSWMLKQDAMVRLSNWCKAWSVQTWMGSLWPHDAQAYTFARHPAHTGNADQGPTGSFQRLCREFQPPLPRVLVLHKAR